jgi:hypothetical protein
MVTMAAAFMLELASRADVDVLPWCLAVPHAGHTASRAKPGSRLRERASVADAGSFVHLSCCCGQTPHEIAADLGIPPAWLHPLACEQTLMLNIQRRLRQDLNDVEMRELLSLKGLTLQQAMLWKASDAGWPPSAWAQEIEVSRAA